MSDKTTMMTHRTTPSSLTGAQVHRRFLAILFVAIGMSLLLWAAFGDSLWRTSVGVSPTRSLTMGTIVRARVPDFMSNTHSRHGIIFIIDPADFSCPPCYDDFQRVSEESGALLGRNADRRGIFLVRQSLEGFWSDSASVWRWADAQGFHFSIVMVPETTYTALGLEGTSIVVVDTFFNTVRVERIPMNTQKHQIIRSLMEG